jgi:hypothetical protein
MRNRLANSLINFNNSNPVGLSAAASPLIAIIPTYNKSTNNSKLLTSLHPLALHKIPLWKYCLTTGTLNNLNGGASSPSPPPSINEPTPGLDSPSPPLS